MQTTTATLMTRHIPNGPARAFLCVLLAFGLLASFNIYAQEPAAPEAAGAEAPHSESMIDRFIEGGWVMYPITACSIALVWLTVDLWMRTGIKKAAPPAQVAQIQDLFRAGDYVGAYQFCKATPPPSPTPPASL
jgi:biopolymer transport protein ExbB